MKYFEERFNDGRRNINSFVNDLKLIVNKIRDLNCRFPGTLRPSAACGYWLEHQIILKHSSSASKTNRHSFGKR